MATLPQQGGAGKVSKREAALAYAAAGWPVVPLHVADPVRGCSCRTGKGCGHPGKHPRTRHGVNDAARDPKQIRAWWEKWPDANIGGATGARSGFIVVDEDPRNGSAESVSQLETRYGPLSPTRTHRTGGGGQHRAFRWKA